MAATKVLLATARDPAEVSIRAIADAVGISTMAIYLHFEDKQALLEAVVEEVFAELPDRMFAAAAGVQDPLAALCAQGSAYVEFALAHPGPYRYAMLEGVSTQRGSRADHAPALSAYRHFASAVTACMKDGSIVRADPLEVSLDFWTVAHGVAALLITNPRLPLRDASAFADRVLRSTALGLGASAMRMPAPAHHLNGVG